MTNLEYARKALEAIAEKCGSGTGPLHDLARVALIETAEPTQDEQDTKIGRGVRRAIELNTNMPTDVLEVQLWKRPDGTIQMAISGVSRTDQNPGVAGEATPGSNDQVPGDSLAPQNAVRDDTHCTDLLTRVKVMEKRLTAHMHDPHYVALLARIKALEERQ